MPVNGIAAPYPEQMAAARSSAKAHNAARPVEPVILRDPRAIKALAHPARLAVIDELFAGRKLTATECGEIAGLSASAMSYHLRALENGGSSADPGDRRRPGTALGGSRRGVDGRLSRTASIGGGRGGAGCPALDCQRADILGWISTGRSDSGLV